MGTSRFVRPDTAILHLSRGDTLTVRRRLNAGEQREAFARIAARDERGVVITDPETGRIKVDPFRLRLGQIVAYLVDWSLTDDEGRPIPIRGLPPDELTSVVDKLFPEDQAELYDAIDAHESRMVAERQAEKNGPDGASKSPAISPSRFDAAGALSGSANSTLTTMPS